MFSKYKKQCNMPSFVAVSEIRSTLEEIFESYTELSKLEDTQMDSDEDNLDASQFINRQYVVSRISNQHQISGELSSKDGKLRTHGKSGTDGVAGNIFTSVSESMQFSTSP